ncbi:MAG TPA: PAS domain S-box protein, partial [Burkholderiaceae bacterium]|nr:PAS domain S-box protein [Burkholderiaceae bacterium]
DGFLWLGTSETIGGYRDLFEPLDARQKIYLRRPGPHGALFPLQRGAAARATLVAVAARTSSAAPELHREADRLLLNRFAPPSVLVSAELDILQYRGDTSPYLAPAPGKATLNLPKMLREGLLVGVRAALQRAEQSGQPTREEGLRVRSHDGWRELAIEVVPLAGNGKDGSPKDGGFLVLFDESGPAGVHASAQDAAALTQPSPDADQDSARLAHELAVTREYLQSVIDQQEAANEELQSSNEEIQSANEELQSINEELETSKEEIQSSNEELATVNDELNSRNSELNRLNNDLVNVFASVQMPIVLVGPDLRVRRFTPAAEKQLHLMPGDIGRPLAHIKLGLVDLPDLDPLLGEVLDKVSSREIETRDSGGNRYLLRLRPYRTLDNKIDGVVLMLLDIELLKRAHEYTASIVETVREPMLVLDSELRVQTASQSFFRHFQVAREQTEGCLLYELGNGQWNIPALRSLLEQVLLGDSSFNDYEVSHEFEQIGKRTMLLNARRLLQPADRGPAMILLAIEDITERKRAELAMAQLAAIVASSRDAIIGKDLNGVITSWNDGAKNLFGYTAEEAIGRPVTLLIPEDHLDEEPAILERIRRGEAIEHYDTVRRHKNGTLLDISLTVSPLKDASGRVVGASKVARDITRQREMSEQVRRSAAELAEGDRHKNEFLAMLAHELRNPLGPIRNALQIIRLANGNGAAIQSATQVMERQIAQMVRLVDDLLDVSRISRGKIELRKVPTDLASVLQHSVETVRPAYQSKGIELTVSLPQRPVVTNADPIRLVQVVSNLLNNACKFTNSGGVWLALERDGDLAVIRVRDSGIGIEADALLRIFDMFVQADTSLERLAGGLGIGLSLVKNLVELHGGTVQGTSAGAGMGSEFVVRLPLAADADAPMATQKTFESASASATTVSRRVLVVDDNRDAAESLAELLKFEGHETRLAHDGLGAVEAAAAFRPDLVLLDIGMPKLNGYDAARKIREQPWGKGMVLVAMTGWGQHEAREKSSRAGFDAHLVKPVKPDMIEELLANLPAT